MPKIVAHKQKLLEDEQPKCELQRIAADLSDAATRRTLLERLADVDHDVVVLTEGVVGYLSNAQVAELANDLRAHAHYRAWIVDHSAPLLNRTVRARVQRKHLGNAPLRFAPNDWEAFFRDHGWRVAELRQLPIEGARLGRPIAASVVVRPCARGLASARTRSHSTHDRLCAPRTSMRSGTPRRR